MKKTITIILSLVLTLASIHSVIFAKSGDIIGYAKYSDISAYINHYPITSFNINGNTAVVAEDLRNYGFNVEWNGEARSLSVTRNYAATQITPYGTVYKYSYKAGQNSYSYLETDIITYVNGQAVESFNIDGNTCIYMNALIPYGEVVWVPEERALKMWINDLPTQAYAAVQEAPIAEQLGLACYDGTDIPKYDNATGAAFQSLNSNIYTYKSNFEQYTAYKELLQQCGWEWNGSDIKHETYLDKNNTFKQRAKSAYTKYKKGSVSITVGYHYQSKNVSIWFYL